MTVKIDADTSSGLQLESDTSGIIDIQSAGVTKMTVGTNIDIQGNTLVLDADADTTIDASTDDTISIKTGNTLRHKISSDGDTNFYRDDGSTVAMKLDASNGNIGIGTTTVASALHVIDAGATPCIFDITGTTGDIVLLRNNGSTKGSISTNGTTVSYNTSSDYRLKENVDYSFDATTRLKQLKPCRFNWIADDTNTLLDGFIAHEVSSVVPEAVNGEKDGDAMQGIDQSKLVPLLVKTIQELEARITALESE